MMQIFWNLGIIKMKTNLSEENTELIRYIEGRFNPGVKPNQAILKNFKDIINGFPW